LADWQRMRVDIAKLKSEIDRIDLAWSDDDQNGIFSGPAAITNASSGAGLVTESVEDSGETAVETTADNETTEAR
jgi:hypothetical protein